VSILFAKGCHPCSDSISFKPRLTIRPRFIIRVYQFVLDLEVFYVYVIIFSLLISPQLGTGLLYELHMRRKGHNPPRRPSVDWLLLKTANADRSTDELINLIGIVNF
jgi:hypothetical protein